MKRRWCRPVATATSFNANDYISTCWLYTATLHCTYGAAYPRSGSWHDGLQHGAPCANSYCNISGSTGEESGEKEGNPLYDINVPGVSDATQVGSTLRNVSWTSIDPGNGDVYHHVGSATVTSRVLEDPNRPNHS